MTLLEKLLAAKTTEFENETKVIYSKRLGQALGEPYAEVKIQGISGRKFGVVKDRANGGGDATFESNLLCCMYGVVDPPLRSEELQKKFGAKTPKDLAEKLFSGEVYQIAEEIVKLSGLMKGEPELEKEVKKLTYRDLDANTAYHLFLLKGWDPEKYYEKDYCGRLVVRAFLHRQIEEMKERGR